MEKLEKAYKAAVALRKAIEIPPKYPVKSLFVSRQAVERFDKIMGELLG